MTVNSMQQKQAKKSSLSDSLMLYVCYQILCITANDSKRPTLSRILLKATPKLTCSCHADIWAHMTPNHHLQPDAAVAADFGYRPEEPQSNQVGNMRAYESEGLNIHT